MVTAADAQEVTTTGNGFGVGGEDVIPHEDTGRFRRGSGFDFDDANPPDIRLGFGPERVHDYEDCLKLDLETFAVFFHKLLNKGVYLPPSTTDAACISAVHTEEDIDKALEAVSQVIKEMGLN